MVAHDAIDLDQIAWPKMLNPHRVKRKHGRVSVAGWFS